MLNRIKFLVLNLGTSLYFAGSVLAIDDNLKSLDLNTAKSSNIFTLAGKRFYIVFVFLVVFWLFSNYFITKVKSGAWTIPDFLKNRFEILKAIGPINENKLTAKDFHSIEMIHKEVMPDGSEFQIIKVDQQKLLFSKTMQHGLKFVKEINDVESLTELDSADK